MQIKPEMQDRYRAAFDKNSDPYGRAVFIYLEALANEYEKRIEAEKPDVTNEEELIAFFEKHHQECERIADEPAGGITGFMYGRAISCLRDCWVHGAALNRWLNRKWNPEQGDEISDNGGSINPAILTIKE